LFSHARLRCKRNRPFFDPSVKKKITKCFPQQELDSNAQSLFDVYIKLPGGRSETEAYLLSLLSVERPFQPVGDDPARQAAALFRGLPPGVAKTGDLPQFPAGTEVALLRRMMLINSSGGAQPTDIVEKVQFRRYESIERFHDDPSSQVFLEYRLSLGKLLEGAGTGLVEIGPKDRRFLTFRSHGIDPIERAPSGSLEPERARPVVLRMCASCHSAAGVYSFQSRARLLEYPEVFLDPQSDSRELKWRTRAVDDNIAVQTKRDRYSWGLFQGLWRTVELDK